MNKKPYKHFSEEYNSSFFENIKIFNKAAEKGAEDYCAFYPSFGSEGKVEFIIYGQAVKGWEPKFKPTEQIEESSFLKKSIEYSNSFYTDEGGKSHSPLDWVNLRWSPGIYKQLSGKEKKYYSDPAWGDYFAFRSFFWNVTYKLIVKYYDLDENCHDWAEKIVWSNLYKIAPAERQNPSEKECTWQQEKSIELVKKEIEEIRPRYCIVLTNDDWWQPFREKLHTKVLLGAKSYEYVQSYEEYQGSTAKIIVTKRPFAGGNSTVCANEVYEIIKGK